MPSIDREKRQRALLDQPGLSPTQANDIEQECERHARNEDARFVGMAQQDVVRVDVMREQNEARLKEFVLNDISNRVSQAKHRRMSASEIAALRDEIQEVVGYYEGDGERQGLLSTIETGYARAEAIIEDPGAAADAFFRKYQTIAETRYR